MATHVFEEISVSAEEILQCSYSSWSRQVPQENLIPSKVLAIPREFLEYLESESITIPRKVEQATPNSDNEFSDWEEEEEERVDPTKNFPQFHQEIIKGIKELGGVIIPKLNWSAPKDATFMMINNEMKCSDVNDVYILLKLSNHINHDLDAAFEEVKEVPNIKYEMVLKQWININPALEFRIFIRQGRIIGVSQRDLNYYDYLEGLKPTFQELIDQFIESIDVNMEKMIIDVYIPKPYNRVIIIDINPFSRKYDPLLYTWNELLQETPNYEIRLINENNLGRFSHKENSENQVPLEVINASMNTESMIELAQKWSSN